jgi:SAM-dependent methyltransferase
MPREIERMPAALRRCLSCGATNPIGEDGPIWPLGWRCDVCGEVVAQADGIAMFAPQLADTVSGIDPGSFHRLSEVEMNHFWFVTRNELIVGLANKFFPTASRLLEIGCGHGIVLQALAQARHWRRLVGTELHPSALAHARERLPRGVEFVQMDARHIPAIAAFDLTGAFDVIEHIPDDEAVLRGLREATVPGGGIIIAVPQHPWLWSDADALAYHQRRYRRGEVEYKLIRSGFEVLFSSSFTSLLMPLMVASRLMRGTSTDDAGGRERFRREFDLDPRLNRIFTALLRGEVRATLAGFPWPVGGSRIVVGRAV